MTAGPVSARRVSAARVVPRGSTSPVPAAGRGAALTGTVRLARLALRQERVVLPVWVASITLLAWGVVASYRGMLPTVQDRVETARIAAGNPLARVFDGPAAGAELGAMALVEGWKVLAVLTALMAAQTVVRHTRRDEEAGRAELVGSGVVGHRAPLVAALAVAALASVAVGAGVVVALAVAEGLPWAGSVAAGAAATGMGLTFAAVAALGAQVFSTARGANGLVAAALGLSFAVRAVGDLAGSVDESGTVVRSTWVSWLSPYGWGQQVRPFLADRWPVLGLFVALGGLLVLAALTMAARRDVGAGLVGQRPGPSAAGAGLGSPWGLAWRLQRASLLAWAVPVVVFGAAFGSMGDEVDDVVRDSRAMQELLAALAPGGEPVELYVVLTAAFLGLAAGGYVVQALLRMRAEEVSGRVEPLLATAVGRGRWLASHVLLALGGSALVLVGGGVAGGLAYGATSGRWRAGLGDFLAAALVQWPAVLALAGLVIAAFGLLPRWAAPVTWFALASALVMSQLGALLELPQWMLDLSPFSHVPAVPVADLAWTPVLWLVAAGVALGLVGAAAFRRRDLAIGA
jgi:ABC-2 type transport system permease protein